MFRILTQPIWRPFWTLRDNFHIKFHTNFHTNFTQFSHPGRGGHLEPFWACPGGGQPSSPALRFAWISGPLLQPPGRTPGQDARGATHHEISRAQPSTTFRLRGNLLQNGATDVVAASGTSAKMSPKNQGFNFLDSGIPKFSRRRPMPAFSPVGFKALQP